jgi:HK97 family phage portal protein
MNILKLFKRKPTEKEKQEEKAVHLPIPYVRANIFNILSSTSIDPEKKLRIAYDFYFSVSPVSTGIDMIVDEFKSIIPLLKDTDTNEFLTEHPLLDLFKTPNADTSREEFFEKIGQDYKISNNAMIVATGNINKPPKELFVINPRDVEIEASKDSPFAERYIYKISENKKIIFEQYEQKGDRFIRYINTDGMTDRELWHIKKPNPFSTLWGISDLNSTYLEIEQYWRSNIHNKSMLKNGYSLSGILSTDRQLTPDQRKNIVEQLQNQYKGDQNAYNLFFAEGSNFKFDPMTNNLKDMDFRDLRKDLKTEIYNRLKVPLPLVSTDNQKYDNYNQARLSLYDNSVIPLTRKLYNELERFLFMRYNLDMKRYDITFNPAQITALQERQTQNHERIKGFLTTNENRGLINYEELEGGDTYYQPSNLVPIGTLPQEPQEPQEPDDKKQIKSRFYSFMRKQLRKDGTRLYSDEYIEKSFNQRMNNAVT